jgi:hypothetical protein
MDWIGKIGWAVTLLGLISLTFDNPWPTLLVVALWFVIIRIGMWFGK